MGPHATRTPHVARAILDVATKPVKYRPHRSIEGNAEGRCAVDATAGGVASLTAIGHRSMLPAA
jgi:hypothetical protein